MMRALKLGKKILRSSSRSSDDLSAVLRTCAHGPFERERKQYNSSTFAVVLANRRLSAQARLLRNLGRD
jgi:hypothetical protein